jgi:hypothetical protein
LSKFIGFLKRGDLFALELLGSNGLLVEQKEWLKVEMLDFDLKQKKLTWNLIIVMETSFVAKVKLQTMHKDTNGNCRQRGH